MLTISIDPIAFNIGSLEIRWYGIMAALGVASLLVIMLREAKRRGIPSDIYGIFFWGVVGGLIGGRLAFVIYYWDHFMANPREIIGFQGLAQMGMIVGIVVAALIYMGVTRMRFSTLLSIGDAFIAAGLLALAIGRIGCTLNGCCYWPAQSFSGFPLGDNVYASRHHPSSVLECTPVPHPDLSCIMESDSLCYSVATLGENSNPRAASCFSVFPCMPSVIWP